MKLLIVTLLVSGLTLAGPGHGHSHSNPHKAHAHGDDHSHKAVSKEKSEEIGMKHVKRLIKTKKIDATWKSAKYEKSEKKKFGAKTEWVVTFINEKGVKGKKLYIFLKETGGFVAANFTGK